MTVLPAVEAVPEIVLPPVDPVFCTVPAACGLVPLRLPATAPLPELTLEPTLDPMLVTSCATVLVS